MVANVTATLEFIENRPDYLTEKPYWCFLAPKEGFDPEARTDNLEFEPHNDVQITDMRGCADLSIETNGFQPVNHESKALEIETLEDVAAYQAETEALLRDMLGAVFVKSFDLRKRKNEPIYRKTWDLNDPLLLEGPARGVHIDLSFNEGRALLGRQMSREERKRYLRPGYRVRIINTWRNLLPVGLEDRPLALCDGRSVDPKDLIATDRVNPHVVGEVYHVRYNPGQRWYWMEKQTSSEPFVFVLYDTKAGDHARYCPHVSFQNPRAPEDAAPRFSVETRNIVITRE